MNNKPDFIRWYGDNSELALLDKISVPNVLLFGGIVIDRTIDESLKIDYLAIKSKYHKGGQFPLKWSFSDYEEKFVSRGHRSLFETLKKEQSVWKEAVIRCITKHECSIVISCLCCKGKSRESLKRTKHELSGTVFGNGLMHFAMHAKELPGSKFEVVLDWPDKAESDPFDEEYRSAYKVGKSAFQGRVPYHSKELKHIGFAEVPLYTRSLYCPMLQLSDIAVGLTRQFVKAVESGAEKPELFSALVTKFRGYPNQITLGLNFSPTRSELATKVKATIAELQRPTIAGVR